METYILLQGKRETNDDYYVFGPNNLGGSGLQGTQQISFGNVNLRCQLVFQVEMLSRQYDLQYIS